MGITGNKERSGRRWLAGRAVVVVLVLVWIKIGLAHTVTYTLSPGSNNATATVHEGHQIITFQLSLPTCYRYRNISWNVPGIGDAWEAHYTTSPDVEGTYIDKYTWTTPDAPPTTYSVTVTGQRIYTCGQGGVSGEWENWSSTVSGNIACNACGDQCSQ